MRKQTSQSFSIISPKQRVSDSALTAIGRLVNEIKENSEQIWTVYRQNFRNSYHGTAMGVLWNFILPLVPITVYLFLTKIRVFPTFDGVSGATFLTFGVTIWFIFVGFVQLPINTVASRSDEAMKTALPLSASIVSAFATLIFETIIRLCLVIAIVIWTQSWPTLSAPLLFLIFLPAFLLFFGAGLILSVLNVVYKDISRVTTILLTYGLFVSGVIFPMGESGIALINARFNPFAVFVNASREIVFNGQLDNYIPLAVWSGIGVITFVVGSRLFYVMEYRIRGLT
jgi:ABC-type polysaccharide/polyol phosphate export permease